MTISIINQKGGVGKTTSTISLAAALTERGRRVAVVDTDDQETAWRYREAIPGAVFQLATLPTLANTIDALRPQVEYILVDSPRSLNDADASVLLHLCDLALITTENELDSLIALVRTVDVAQLIQARGDHPLEYRVLLSKNSVAGHRRHVRDSIKKDFGHVMTKAAIPNSAAFGAAAFHTQTILQHAPASSGAKAVRKLAAEVEAINNA